MIRKGHRSVNVARRACGYLERRGVCSATPHPSRPYLIQVLWHVSLEFNSPISSPLLPLPSPLRRYNSHALLLAGREDLPRLPPFVVARVGDVQDVAVAEWQSPAGQSVVLVRIVIEQRPATKISIQSSGQTSTSSHTPHKQGINPSNRVSGGTAQGISLCQAFPQPSTTGNPQNNPST